MASNSLLNDREDVITEILTSQTSLNDEEPPNAPNLDGLPSGTVRKKAVSSLPTEPLHKQGYIIFLVLVYAAIFITGWYIIVLTSKHPIGRKSYNCFDKAGCSWSAETLEKQNDTTSWYIKKAQTLLATVSLLTIPLTSAVCAAAVIPWLQQSGQGMSLRQMITLADKGWTSPYIYYRLLTPSGWKRYGSSFIMLALLLHALGAGLSPAISQTSAVRTIKVPAASPGGSPSVRYLKTLQDLLSNDHFDKAFILKLRGMLEAEDPNQIQAGLWVPHNKSCAALSSYTSDPENMFLRSQCDTGGLLTYLSVANETEVFQSQLSNGFATGVMTKQYLPRVNSSVSIEVVRDMPPDCTAEKAALLINYAGMGGGNTSVNTTQYMWSIQACVPTYPVKSLYNQTDNAQTLVETAYLDLYTYDIMNRRFRNRTKITMSTTVGYFELPNYDNHNTPGPLLKEFTLPKSSNRLRKRGDIPKMPIYPTTLQSNATNSVPGIANLELLPLKGPLLNIIYALFGNGSLPSTYAAENATYNAGWTGENNNNLCLDLIPLATLARMYSNINGEYSNLCLDWWSMAQGAQMYMFLSNFFIETSSLEKVFRTAAYMSHSIWLGLSIYGTHSIQYDAGRDMQKPGLTNKSIIVLTIAIAVFLLSLLLLAFYASFSRTWTYSLDAYALLRVGADLGGDALPFLLVEDANRIGELDELPGWVGDVSSKPGEKAGNIGQLGVGFKGTVAPLKPDGRYRSYSSMPGSRWGIFDYVIRLCGTACSLGGLRETHTGQNLVHFRERVRGQRKQAAKRYERWMGKMWDSIMPTMPLDKPSENFSYRTVGPERSMAP